MLDSEETLLHHLLQYRRLRHHQPLSVVLEQGHKPSLLDLAVPHHQRLQEQEQQELLLQAVLAALEAAPVGIPRAVLAQAVQEV